MASGNGVGNGKGLFGVYAIGRRAYRLPIAVKLNLTFLLVIGLLSLVFILAGIRLIGNRIVAEAQEKVRYDLNAAQVIYQNKLARINDVVRFTADRALLIDALWAGNVELVGDELARIRVREQLDVLTITDPRGRVILRSSNASAIGDDQSQDELVREVLKRQVPVSATTIVSAAELRRESPLLANRAHFEFIDTPMARTRPETEQTAGMMLKAAAPIYDFQRNLIGVVYGGSLLNRNYELVDKVKQTVFQDLQYDGKDIGTATIFQDDVRISTNVRNAGGTRAIGTRVTEEVYNQVVVNGKEWIGRAYVVNNWYITAYEPIRNIDNQVIGILYVGILEQKYVDIQRQTVLVFLFITILGIVIAMAISYFISRVILESVNKLAFASREVAHGNLDVNVDIRSNDELRELADTFNYMTSALQERDRQLKEATTKRIMESERLALIGQLAANVAHELNNPLQGIVAYSHLVLEKMPTDTPGRRSIEKIVVQANRATEIIRGLLDFSRQRKPLKQPSSVNQILQECVALVEDQAVFHNIEVVRELQEPLPPVVVDPAQMQQVFMNMIINAAEAMDGSGRLTLTTRCGSDDRSVEVEFTDTGQGIDEAHLERIFDPFFTTKQVGHGTGLGLAICYGIVKEHKGMIAVESEVDKGTTFTLKLPLNGNGAG